MKKILSCLLAITMIITLLPGYVKASDSEATTASSGTWLGMKYTTSDENNDGTKETLTLSGTQTTEVERIYSSKSNYYTKAPYYQNSKITRVVVNATLTNAYYLFAGCSNLKSITFGSAFDISNATSIAAMFNDCENLTTLDLSKFKTSKVTFMSCMFDGCKKLTKLNIANFDTSNVDDMSCMFSNCENLTDLDVSKFKTSNVTSMLGMFDGCKKLTKLNVSNFDTSNVTSMSCMFLDCENLTILDVSKFNTRNVKSMSEMFDGCKKLATLNVSNFDTTNVTDMYGMFSDCEKLTKLDVSNFNTSKVTKMNAMFDSCKKLVSLNVSNFDTSNVIDMCWMFGECENLTMLDASKFNTSKVKSMCGMFNRCKNLTKLNVSNFETTNVKDMSYMFRGCKNLTTLNINNFNTSNVTEMEYMFYYCCNLKELDLSSFDITNINDTSYMFNYCTSLHYLKTPAKTNGNVVSLPFDFYELQESNKTVGTTAYTEIPVNATKSISLVTEKHAVSKSSTTATCTKAGVTTGKCDICGSKVTTSADALGHDYGTPTYTWSDDGKTCTAQRVCNRDKSHEETETAVITSQVKVEPTTTTRGMTTYTATFKNTAFTTQTKDVEDLPATPVEDSTGSSESPQVKPEVKTDGENTSQSSNEEITSSISDEENSLIFDSDIDNREDELSPFSCLQLKLTTKVSKGKVKATLKWKSVEGADGYIIYSAKCGKALSRVATVEASKTSWSQSKLKKNTYYKYLVVAYKGDSVLCTSKTVHGIAGSKKFSNPVKIKGLKKNLTVKVGKSSKLKGKVTCEKKKKIQKHVAALRYESADTSIATVSKKGKVTGISKGKTVIYAYAQNGLCKKIKVTVK